MNPITENPYRILGVLAGCSERELLRQATKISRYADIGQAVEFDYDFIFFGGFKRDPISLKKASSRLEQAAQKVHWALFWFVKANHIDDAALSHLKDGNLQKAADIWALPLKGKEISSRNYSAAINLSTLQIFASTKHRDLDSALFKKSIGLKGKVLCSVAFDDYVELVTGEKQTGIRDLIIKEFVDETLQLIKSFLDKPNGIPARQFISAFAKFPEEISLYLKNKFTAAEIRRVEKELDSVRKGIKENPADAGTFGVGLFQRTTEDLKTIRKILGSKSVQFQTLNNKVAEEILQCSISYFIHFRDHDSVDPGPIALELLRLARGMEPTGAVNHRIEENAPTIEKWVEDEPERKKQRLTSIDFEYIRLLLDQFQELEPEISNAGKLLTQAKPKLEKIGQILGRRDDVYLMLSSAVVGNATGMAVSVVNEKQERCDPSSLHGDKHDNMYSMLIRNRIFELVEAVKSAHQVMTYAGSFDMGTDQRQRLRRDKEALEAIMVSLGIPVPSAQAVPRPSSPAKEHVLVASPNLGKEYLPTSSRSKKQIWTGENAFSGILANQGTGLRGFISNNPGLAGMLALGLVIALIFSVVQIIEFVSSFPGSSTAGSENKLISPAVSKPPQGMVYVPGGAVLSKSDTMKGFFMDIYETTNQDYSDFLAATNHPRPPGWKEIPATQAKFPVVGITWEDAKTYAKWKEKRLPTDEEWELASRGNEKRIYPWGNEWIPGYANANNSMKSLTQVGAFPLGASVYGIHDMSGNAWEWTSSDFKGGSGASKPHKTIRGGAFSSKKEDATTTSKIGWPAVGAKDYSLIGFRCVKDIEATGK